MHHTWKLNLSHVNLKACSWIANKQVAIDPGVSGLTLYSQQVVQESTKQSVGQTHIHDYTDDNVQDTDRLILWHITRFTKLE